MTKKISILAIVFSGILSSVSYADTVSPGTNTGKTEAETEAVEQNTVNIRANISFPATVTSSNYITNSKGAIGLQKNSLGGKSISSEGWAKSVVGESFNYVSIIDGTTKNSCTESSNCSAGNSSSDTKTCGNITLPTGYNCNNGFVTPPAEVKISEDKKFYRFWQVVDPADYDGCESDSPTYTYKNGEAHCECEFGKLGGCWSPLYPIINSIGSDGKSLAPKLIAAINAGTISRTDAEKFFGERSKYYNTEGKDEKNQYESEKYKYRMKVRVAPMVDGKRGDVVKNITNQGSKHNEGSEVVLSVNSWTSKNGGLDPNFNYSLSNTDLKTDVLNKLSDGLSSTDNVDKTQDILPCGMYTPGSASTGYDKVTGAKCSPNYTRITKEKDNNTGVLKQLYTRYHIALPTGPNTYESNYTHTLNVRACAKCESVSTHCSDIIYQLVQNNSSLKNVCSLLEYLRKTSSYTYDIGTFDTPKTGMTCDDCLAKIDTILNEARFKEILTPCS